MISIERVKIKMIVLFAVLVVYDAGPTANRLWVNELIIVIMMRLNDSDHILVACVPCSLTVFFLSLIDSVSVWCLTLFVNSFFSEFN